MVPVNNPPWACIRFVLKLRLFRLKSNVSVVPRCHRHYARLYRRLFGRSRSFSTKPVKLSVTHETNRISTDRTSVSEITKFSSRLASRARVFHDDIVGFKCELVSSLRQTRKQPPFPHYRLRAQHWFSNNKFHFDFRSL